MYRMCHEPKVHHMNWKPASAEQPLAAETELAFDRFTMQIIRNLDVHFHPLPKIDHARCVHNLRPLPAYIWRAQPLDTVLGAIRDLAPVDVWVTPGDHDVSVRRQRRGRVVHPGDVALRQALHETLPGGRSGLVEHRRA